MHIFWSFTYQSNEKKNLKIKKKFCSSFKVDYQWEAWKFKEVRTVRNYYPFQSWLLPLGSNLKVFKTSKNKLNYILKTITTYMSCFIIILPINFVVIHRPLWGIYPFFSLQFTFSQNKQILRVGLLKYEWDECGASKSVHYRRLAASGQYICTKTMQIIY